MNQDGRYSKSPAVYCDNQPPLRIILGDTQVEWVMNSLLSPEEFVERWQKPELNESKIYREHFRDVCYMVGYEPPGNVGRDYRGNIFQFEYGVRKSTGKHGFADVYLQHHFAAEYKSPGKYNDLREAYNQLLQYHENLQSPPLL